jgi:hypothetical protein
MEADIADLTNENAHLRKQIQAMKIEYSSLPRRQSYDPAIDDALPAAPQPRSYGSLGYNVPSYIPSSQLPPSSSSGRQSLSSSVSSSTAGRYADYRASDDSLGLRGSSIDAATRPSANVKSLASLVGSKSDVSSSVAAKPFNSSSSNRSSLGGGSVPFATEHSTEMMSYFDGLDRQLTGLTSERTSLLEEAERYAAIKL